MPVTVLQEARRSNEVQRVLLFTAGLYIITLVVFVLIMVLMSYRIDQLNHRVSCLQQTPHRKGC